MANIDATSSTLFQPIARIGGGLADLWRFLTRPVSADFRNDPEATRSGERPRRREDKEWDRDSRFHEYVNWHHS